MNQEWYEIDLQKLDLERIDRYDLYGQIYQIFKITMNDEYRQELNKIIIAKRKELRYRQNRLNSNIFVGVCNKSIIIQRKNILYLKTQIDNLEYKLQHNL